MRSIAMSIAWLILLFFISAANSKENSVEVLGYLPDKGFTASGPAEHFVGKKLFKYMNGGAELYLAYGFVDLGVREYKSGQQNAAVAIYRMKHPEGAFGLSLAVSSGQAVELNGISAVSSPGAFCFYKGKVLVRIVAKSDIESEKTKGFLLKLGKCVETKLPGKTLAKVGKTPLPKGWTKGSLRYLINPDTAQTIWFSGEGKILLSEQANAFTAFYAGKQGDLQVTHASYPSPVTAKTACQKLAEELNLKPAKNESDCEFFGKGPDEMQHLVKTNQNALIWIAGAPDINTARVWLKKPNSRVKIKLITYNIPSNLGVKMNKTSKWLVFGCLIASFVLATCSGASKQQPSSKQPAKQPRIKGPEKIVLLDKGVTLQDEHEPYQTSVTLDFKLPSRPRRARLLLRYSGVPGATSKDYLMGRFRHKVELNNRYLMDLNTFSQGQDQIVEHTKWISVRMLFSNNVLDFIAGDDGNRQGRPNCDEFDLHSVILEFDW